jgi:signal transduction histidine kinase/HAMP domain-containing protein
MLSKLNVTKKLLVAFFVPVILLILTTWQEFNAAHRLEKEYSQFDHLLAIAYKASDFVHELQKERGASSIYIGTAGKRFSSQLRKQKEITDMAKMQLKTLIDESATAQAKKRLSERFIELYQWIDDLGVHREEVVNLQQPASSSFTFYTRANSFLIKFIADLFLNVPDKKTAMLFKGLLYFIEAKEQAGQERALLGKVFSEDKLTASDYKRLVSLVISQQLAFHHFLDSATAAQEQLYRERLNTLVESPVNDMRKVVLERYNQASLMVQLEAIFGIGGLFSADIPAPQQKMLMAKALRILGELQTLESIDKARNQQLQRIRQMLTLYPAIDPVEMQNAMQNLRNSQFNVKPSAWFTVSSKRINALRTIEQSIASDIELYSNDLLLKVKLKIQRQMYLWLGLGLLVAIFYQSILRRMIICIRSINSGVTRFTEGELEHRIDVQGRDEFANMAASFNAMANNLHNNIKSMEADNVNLDILIADSVEKLEQQNQQMAVQNWVNEGRAKLSDTLRGDIDNLQLFEKMLAFMREYLDCATGVFYEACEEGTLLLRASHGVSANQPFSPMIKKGEGIIGQLAKENQTVVIQSDQLNGFEIDTGIGLATPHSLIYIPIYAENRLLAMMALCAISEPEQHADAFITAAKEQMAVAIEMAISRSRLRRLLSETRSQSEELEQRQLALTESNELLSQKSLILERQKQDIAIKSKKIKLSNDELIEASRYKSEFLASMSHELRTPLNSMLVLSQKLSQNRHSRLSDKEVGYANVIHRAGSDLLFLINDILDVSKLESGNLNVLVETTPVQNIIEEVYATHLDAAQEKGLLFECDFEKVKDIKISTDGLKVKQILHNFISNALKFTEKGRLGIVATLIEEADNQMLRLAIKDSGKGIAKDKIDVMFDMFTQEDSAISRRFGGSGLGLYLCAKLAKIIEGSIEVDSEVNRGSEFALLLPLNINAEPSTGPVVNIAPVPKSIGHGTQQQVELPIQISQGEAHNRQYEDTRLITLGNNARSLMQLKSLLNDNAIETIVAPTPALAKQKLTDDLTANAVIVDLDDQSEDVIVELLACIEQTFELPIVVLKDEKHSHFVASSSAVSCLQKPVASAALFEVIDNILQGVTH